MRKFFATLTALIVIAVSATVFAAEEPTCIFLRFTNDTRFKNIDSASVLSDLVMEKLLASGRFNLMETKPLDEDIEAMLYSEKVRELKYFTTGVKKNNLSELFEGPGFDNTKAQSIATAEVGQTIMPSIIDAIAKDHKADYLIQGNVINMGDGAWNDENSGLYEKGLNTLIGSALGGGGVGGGMFSFERIEAGIGIETDLRIIKASTGEVIWRKTVIGNKKTALNKVKLGLLPSLKFGSAKLSSDMYNQAMDRAAQNIVDAMIKDLDEGILFVK